MYGIKHHREDTVVVIHTSAPTIDKKFQYYDLNIDHIIIKPFDDSFGNWLIFLYTFTALVDNQPYGVVRKLRS